MTCVLNVRHVLIVIPSSFAVSTVSIAVPAVFIKLFTETLLNDDVLIIFVFSSFRNVLRAPLPDEIYCPLAGHICDADLHFIFSVVFYSNMIIQRIIACGIICIDDRCCCWWWWEQIIYVYNPEYWPGYWALWHTHSTVEDL